jgi:hypothetical protein
LAKHTADVIEMLAAKTKGNLDEEESRLLEALREELGREVAKHGKS